jgi:hypothetical protein
MLSERLYVDGVDEAFKFSALSFREGNMAKHPATTALCVSFLLWLQLSIHSAAQAKPAAAPASAPTPAQILAAKKVFVANAGGEQPWDEDADFSGGTDRAYNEFYIAMKAWGRYELADAPADADLLFEIQFACPAAVAVASAVRDSLAGRPYDPQFRVVIRDAKNNALLWTLSERAQWALTRGNRDKNFDQALDRIVGDVQVLAGASVGSASAAKQ